MAKDVYFECSCKECGTEFHIKNYKTKDTPEFCSFCGKKGLDVDENTYTFDDSLDVDEAFETYELYEDEEDE